MQALVLTTEQADIVRGPTLNPRLIAAGPYAGKYALGMGVLSDPIHAEHHDLLAECVVDDFDPATAWPEPE